LRREENSSKKVEAVSADTSSGVGVNNRAFGDVVIPVLLLAGDSSPFLRNNRWRIERKRDCLGPASILNETLGLA
jgi:hypothetical protein